MENHIHEIGLIHYGSKKRYIIKYMCIKDCPKVFSSKEAVKFLVTNFGEEGLKKWEELCKEKEEILKSVENF